jgi:hypothetical protein
MYNFLLKSSKPFQSSMPYLAGSASDVLFSPADQRSISECLCVFALRAEVGFWFAHPELCSAATPGRPHPHLPEAGAGRGPDPVEREVPHLPLAQPRPLNPAPPQCNLQEARHIAQENPAPARSCFPSTARECRRLIPTAAEATKCVKKNREKESSERGVVKKQAG